jgi:ferredoxin-NADP reductase
MAAQSYTAHVIRVEALTHDVRAIELALRDPKDILFKAGQFVSFEVPHPRTGRLVTRPYSIASSPGRSNVITLLLNLVPGGPGSTYLFGLKEGDETHLKGPAGHFYLGRTLGVSSCSWRPAPASRRFGPCCR